MFENCNHRLITVFTVAIHPVVLNTLTGSELFKFGKEIKCQNTQCTYIQCHYSLVSKIPRNYGKLSEYSVLLQLNVRTFSVITVTNILCKYSKVKTFSEITVKCPNIQCIYSQISEYSV